MDQDKERNFEVIPVFISVDPTRDTIERVKEYCLEFSPKLRGFTGAKDQVNYVYYEKIFMRMCGIIFILFLFLLFLLFHLTATI